MRYRILLSSLYLYPSFRCNHNPGYSGTCNHVPREAAEVTLSKFVPVVESNGFYLNNCSKEAMSDQQRLKMGKLCLINRDLKMVLRKMVSETDRYITGKVAWYNEHAAAYNLK